MGIFPGGVEVKSVYAGAPVKEVYAGSELVWSSGPEWPKTGTWPGGVVPGSSATTVASFVVPEAGRFKIRWEMTITTTPSFEANAYIYVNGGNQKTGSGVRAPGTSVAEVELQLAAGDLVEFKVRQFNEDGMSSGGEWSVALLHSGTWSGESTDTRTTVGSFTAPEAGSYDVNWAVTWDRLSTTNGVASFRVNGGPLVSGSNVVTRGTSTAAGPVIGLSAGDVIEFMVRSANSGREATGVWTVRPITFFGHGTYNLTNGASGYYDVGTWTAPTAGTYTLYIDRLGVEYPATSISINGQVNGGPETNGPPRARMLVRTLNAGDVVKFVLSNSPGMIVPATGNWAVY